MTPKRVLIVRVGAMGDVLHALPAAAGLRHGYPGVQIDWAVDPRWAPLLAGDDGCGPIVSRIFPVATRLWSASPLSLATAHSILSLRRSIRGAAYDFVADLQGTLRSAVIGSFARGDTLAGYADPREAVARRFYARRLQRRGTHVVEQGAALLGEAVGHLLEPRVPALPRNQEAERWAEAFLASRRSRSRGLALLAPTAGWGAKQWPATRFAELAQALAAERWTVLVNAASPDDPTGAAVVSGSQGAAELVPCSLPQLVALVGGTDVVVGGDSGPIHLAAALGTPCVALYGPTDPARNGPWGQGRKVVLRNAASVTSHKRVPTVDPGLERITIREVLDAVASLHPF